MLIPTYDQNLDIYVTNNIYVNKQFIGVFINAGFVS